MSDQGLYGLKMRNAVKKTGDTMTGTLTINDSSVGAGLTGFIIYWNNAGTMTARQVNIGAPNSAGAGFRLLMIAN